MDSGLSPKKKHVRRRIVRRERAELETEGALRPKPCPLRCVNPPTFTDIDGDRICVNCGRAR